MYPRRRSIRKGLICFRSMAYQVQSIKLLVSFSIHLKKKKESFSFYVRFSLILLNILGKPFIIIQAPTTILTDKNIFYFYKKRQTREKQFIEYKAPTSEWTELYLYFVEYFNNKIEQSWTQMKPNYRILVRKLILADSNKLSSNLHSSTQTLRASVKHKFIIYFDT